MLKLNIQMFADGKVVIETDLNQKGFEKGLSKIQSIAKTGFKGISIAVGAVSTAMAGALANGVKFNSEIEQLQTSFEVMTGDANKAREVIQKLKDIGAKTPYELKGLAKTTQLLMQYGFTADDAYDATVNLGDIAQGNAEKMESIALAFGQMSSLGKVTMQDIKQMINAGFNPLQAIAEMTGETLEEVNARYEEGAISVEEVTKAMKYASSENGKFYKSMEKQSKTLAGQISTLKDNFDSLTGTLSEGLSKTISGEVLPSINDLLQNMERAFSKGGIPALAKAVGEGIANILTAIVNEAPKFINVALTIVDNLITGINENLPQITNSAIELVGNFISAVLSMAPNILQLGMDLIINIANGISQKLPDIIPQVVDAIIQMFNVLSDPKNIEKIAQSGAQLILGLIKGILDSIPKLIENANFTITMWLNVLSGGQRVLTQFAFKLGISLIKSLIMGIINSLPEFAESIFIIVKTFIDKISSFASNLYVKGSELVTNLINGFRENGISYIKTVGKQLIEGLWKGIEEKWNALKQKVSKLAGEVVKRFKSVFGIKSPSRVFRDEIGKYLAEGMGVGFEDELSNVYRDMQHAINFEQSKLQASVETGRVFNTLQNSTPVAISINGNVEMDSQKVGRLVTPSVTRTIKNGGGI